MAAPDITNEMMSLFADSGLNDHTTLLVGAGASASAGFPTWDELAARILMASKVVEDEELARLLTESQDPVIVVESARNGKLGDQWEKLLKRCLYTGIQDEEPSALHVAVASHLVNTPESTTLLTLNFDTLLETAANQSENLVTTSQTDGTVSENRLDVHHLHGLITRHECKDVVLTFTDFISVMTKETPWQESAIASALERGALIVAGTSYRDPDIRQWLHLAIEAHQGNNKAIVLLTRESFNLTKHEFSAVEQALSNQWKAVGLTPLLLQDHADAAQIITDLAYVGQPDYLSPQDRARKMFSAHLTDFAERQSGYVDAMAEDFDVMQDALNVDSFNMTLWLADGQGHIIRWATQDKKFLDESALRKVPSGHDSSWVAGQALGLDDLVVADLDSYPTRRWQSVLAMPIALRYGQLPKMSAGVITFGLPKPKQEYLESMGFWAEPLTEIAEKWSTRISET